MKPSLTAFALAATALGQTPPAPMKAAMIVLGVRDMDRSVRFYRDVLHLPVSGAPDGDITLLQAGALTIVLNRPLAKAAGGAIVGATEVVFPVDSVAAAHKDLAGRGCAFSASPHEISPGMWAATFTDPDGHRLTILGPK